MPRQEWSFFMPAEDHRQLKWLMAYGLSRYTAWGLIMGSTFLAGLAVSSVGVKISAYLLPSFVLSLWITTVTLSLFFKPKIEARRVLPESPVAGGELVYKIIVKNTGRGPIRSLAVYESCLPYGLYPHLFHPESRNTADWLDAGEQAELTMVFRVPRRGTYEISPLIAGSSFPSGFIRAVRRAGGRDRLTVYPRFTRRTDFQAPLLQQYQPGGIALSSKTGDSSEFASTREYRDGDRLRDVHWVSSARTGRLIVRENIEEYFVRVGLFLDTELKRFEKHRCFEGRISLCAGVADQLNSQDYIIDLFSTEDHLPHVQIGRGVEQFTHLLESLSVIDGAREVDFNDAAARVREHAPRLSMLAVFLKDWDEPRKAFARGLADLGLNVRCLVVRDKPTTLPVEPGTVSVLTPEEVEAAP